MSFSAGNFKSVTEFLQKAVTLSVFELETCALHTNWAELEQDYKCIQITHNLACKNWYKEPSGQFYIIL